MRTSFHSFALPLVVVAAQGMWAGAVSAQVGGDPARAAVEEVEEIKKKTKTRFLVVPVPFSDPAAGTGIALGGVVFYNPNNGEHQWTSGAGAVWSSRGSGSRGIAAFHKMYLYDDKFRLNAMGSLFDKDDRYYGIGAEDGDRDAVLDLDTKEAKLKVRGLWEISGKDIFLGAQYQFLVNEAVPKDNESAVTPPPEEQLDSTMSVIGPVAVYDTRDNHDQPRQGVYLMAGWLFGDEAIGDSFSHNLFTLQANAYRPTGKNTVIAGRLSLCSAGGDPAYYALCKYGSNESLRGYPSDRYRDRASWTLQGEVRHQFDSRWGGTAFFGVGGIAPKAGDLFSDSNFLPAGGVGIRYRPFKDNDVRLRLDFGWGKDAEGFYLSIGEAF